MIVKTPPRTPPRGLTGWANRNPPAPPLRASADALRSGAGPSHWLPGQPAKQQQLTAETQAA